VRRARAIRFCAALACGTACCASQAQGGGQASAPGASSGKANPGPHSLVVIPAAMSMSMDFAKGCWVRLYDGKNYRGHELMLVGPLQLAGMDATSPWWRRWNSAIVGPNASVSIYSKKNYQGRSASLAAQQRSADLAQRAVSWSGKIESAKVACSAS
jgi:Beta/Gamma crystallin